MCLWNLIHGSRLTDTTTHRNFYSGNQPNKYKQYMQELIKMPGKKWVLNVNLKTEGE